jgi:hypothetical protein
MIGLGVSSYFHNKSMNVKCHTIVKWMFVSKKKVAHLILLLFFEFISSCNETCQKVWGSLFLDLLKTFVLFIGGVCCKFKSL